MRGRRIAVIGGGLAGLAAACRLRALGADPEVFERDVAVGGVVRTVRQDGWIADTGPAMAAEPHPAVRAMLDQAGMMALTQRAGPDRNNRFIVRDGVPVAVPHNTSEFASSPLLSLAGRLRLIKERFVPARQGDDEESVDSFSRRRFGDEMAERLFDPLVASMAAGDPAQLLARYTFPGLVGHERHAGSGMQGSMRARIESRRHPKTAPSASWTCVEGMEQLPRQLAEWVGGIRTKQSVAAVRHQNRAIEIGLDDGSHQPFDAAVFAVPAPAFATLRVDLPGGERLSQVATLPHASLVTVVLGFRRDHVAHPLNGTRLLVPSIEKREILSVVFPSSVFEHHAPPDHVLLTTFLGGARRADLIDWPEGDLIALVERELGELLGVTGTPALTVVAIRRNALPQAVAGHAARLAAADLVEAATGNVAFTGSWRDGLSVCDVLLGGFNAAERLMARAAV